MTRNLALVVGALSAGALMACNYSPHFNANGFACKATADCPPGYVCTDATSSQPGICCNHLVSGQCLSLDSGLSPGTNYQSCGVGGDSGSGGNGGSTGMDGVVELVAFAPISVSPAAGSTDTPPSATIFATFSSAMDATTITTATFVVERGSVPVSGTVSVSAGVATFTPSRPLVLAASYRASIAGIVKDASGTAMGADYPWTFTVRDGTFGASQVVSATGQSTQDLVLGTNSKGDAMAAWTQVDSGSSRAYSARFSPAAGWSSPVLLDASSSSPVVAMSDDGSALALFTTPAGVASSELSLSAGWSIPIAFASTASYPSLAMDTAGRALALYLNSDGAVAAQSFTPGSGWGTEHLLDSGGEYAQLALSPAGTGIAVFLENTDSGSRYFAARYTETGWQSVLPANPPGSVGYLPAVSVDSVGNPVFLWSEDDQVLAAHLASGVWSTPQVLRSGSGDNPLVALSQEPTDNMVALMSSGDLWASILAAGSCRLGKQLNVSNDSITGPPAAAMAPNGNAIVAWIQDGAVWATRQIEGKGWTLSEPLSDGAATPGPLWMHMDSSGRATIVFLRADSSTTNHVCAIRFE